MLRILMVGYVLQSKDCTHPTLERKIIFAKRTHFSFNNASSMKAVYSSPVSREDHGTGFLWNDNQPENALDIYFIGSDSVTS
jgi:hypothetical protein